VVVIDELGKMELASERFRDAVVERDLTIAATVHAFPHPLTDELKRRPGVRRIAITRRNRDALPEELAARLA